MSLCGCSAFGLICYPAGKSPPASGKDCDTLDDEEAALCKNALDDIEETPIWDLPAQPSPESIVRSGSPKEWADTCGAEPAARDSRPTPAALDGMEIQDALQQEAQIDKDLPRTFPGLPAVCDRTSVIRQILLDYAVVDPDVGYCQGMSFVAAVVSANVPDPLEASRRFREIITDVRGLWLPGFPLLVAGVLTFDALLRTRLPALYDHLVRLQMMLDSFLPDVWLTLFASWLPFASLWPALQFLQGCGFVGVLSLTLELIGAHAPALQSAEDFCQLYGLLKSLHEAPRQPDVEEILALAEASIGEIRDVLSTPPEELDGGPEFKRLISAASRSSSSMSLTRQGSTVVNTWSGFNLLEDAEKLQLLYSGLVYRVGHAVHTAAHAAHDAVHGVGHSVGHGAKHVVHGAKDVAAGAAVAAYTCEKALAAKLAANSGAFRAAATAAHVSQEVRHALMLVGPLYRRPDCVSVGILHRITEEQSEDVLTVASSVTSPASGSQSKGSAGGHPGASRWQRGCWCCARRVPAARAPPPEAALPPC